MNNILVVICNNDVLAALPFNDEPFFLRDLREKIKVMLDEHNKHFRFENDKVQIRCQIVGVENSVSSLEETFEMIVARSGV